MSPDRTARSVGTAVGIAAFVVAGSGVSAGFAREDPWMAAAGISIAAGLYLLYPFHGLVVAVERIADGG